MSSCTHAVNRMRMVMVVILYVHRKLQIEVFVIQNRGSVQSSESDLREELQAAALDRNVKVTVSVIEDVPDFKKFTEIQFYTLKLKPHEDTLTLYFLNFIVQHHRGYHGIVYLVFHFQCCFTMRFKNSPLEQTTNCNIDKAKSLYQFNPFLFSQVFFRLNITIEVKHFN